MKKIVIEVANGPEGEHLFAHGDHQFYLSGRCLGLGLRLWPDWHPVVKD